MLEKASERLKSAEDRLEKMERKLTALEGKLGELARHRHPEYAEVEGLSEVQEAVEGLRSLARSLEAKYEALSRAVEEMKGKLAKHDAELADHNEWLRYRYKDDKNFVKHFNAVYDRLDKLEKRIKEVSTRVVKLHPRQFRKG